MSQTAKVLLLYAHPESQDSVANRVLLEPALQLPNVTVHDLYAHYPDFFYRYCLRTGPAAPA
ncbi:glutathione-regulated potassium-efflux system ancillary protein KefG [Klebsiella pneumoniae]|uniref:Glutathione-regulated potassium-efflux system ancillary protein KefG n=2 Tax=Klebsiella pneumoniae TaxID=573 RepID=A0A2X3GEC1_KLEPN|nr:Glutathione-regulated potassium-efflux system ancillary protein KefG [Klebsiella pneumoniae IS43]CDL64611.1 Glutathione-regulated potassium-efflux system ancillary protein KefG [Klebsiella pneumoniae IS39]SQC58551.1 glutathione-regulated potassium-efflux system ancillary protein KefG [Klebsiella pneumoniae]